MEQMDTYVGIMLDSLKRKKSYLEEILTLTEKQSEIADSDAFDDEVFGETVDRKEILIDNINEIDKGFTSVYDRIRGNLLDNKDKYLDELKSMQDLIRFCMDAGLKIEALEERNRAKLEFALANRQKNYRQVKQSRSIVNKYYRGMSGSIINDSMLYDRKK
ncbi:MAG: hypothetical protein IJV15_08730 [Lachnospiraceae bacterium]|nr:hypothetical protein [Lachnospiraceae bacterium]